MVASIIFGLFAGQVQAPGISIELRGVRMENAAPILAKALGMPGLEIDSHLKDDVILVRTKNVAPEQLKAKLAKVLNASWVQTEASWLLGQTNEQRMADKTEEKMTRFKFFSSLVEKSKKTLGNLKPFDEQECLRLQNEIKTLSKLPYRDNDMNFYRLTERIDESGPKSRFVNRLVSRVSVSDWMKLTEQKPRIVFCSRPNSMQQSFSFQIGDLVSMAISEQNLWAKYGGGDPVEAKTSGDDEENELSNYLGELNDLREKTKQSDFGYVTMTLDLHSEDISIVVYDEEGMKTHSGSISTFDFESYLKSNEESVIAAKNPKKKPKYSGDVAEFLNLMSPVNEFGSRRLNLKPLSESLVQKLLHPETTDPLSIAAPDVLLESIASPNVILKLKDELVNTRDPIFEGPDPDLYDGEVMKDADGWFLVRQPNPLHFRRSMPNRKKLGGIIQFAINNRRPLTLEERAKLAFELPWDRAAFDNFETHIKPILVSEVEGPDNRSALRIYGSMTAEQRDQAKKGGILVSRLSEATKEEFFRGLFYADSYESHAETNGMTEVMYEPGNGKDRNLTRNGVYEENTFLFPKGFIGDYLISIDESVEETLHCGIKESIEHESSMYYDGNTISPFEFGEFLFQSTNPGRYKRYMERTAPFDENDIHLASKRDITIKIQVKNEVSVAWRLSQTLITDPKTYTSKTLPANVLKALKEGYDLAAQNDRENGQEYDKIGKRKIVPPIEVLN